MGMFRASVPEAAIHENNKSGTEEGKVRTSQNGKVPPPSSDFVLAKENQERNFRGLVAASAYEGHDLGTLGLCENVRHWRTCQMRRQD